MVSLNGRQIFASVLMNATNEVVDYQMQEIFKGGDGIGNTIVSRLPSMLPIRPSMMPALENIQALEKYAQNLIKNRQEELNEIAHLLDDEGGKNG